MRNLGQLVKKIPEKIGFGILGTALYGLVSCASLYEMTDAQKTTLAGNILMESSQYSKDPKSARNAVTLGSALSTLGQMQHDIEVAKAGKDQITINNNLNSGQRQQDNSNESLLRKEKEYSSDEFLRNMDYEERWKLVKELKNIDRTSMTFEEKKSLDNLLSIANSTPTGFFMYEKYGDFNGDEKADFDEYTNLNKSAYSSNLDHLTFSFFSGGSHVYDGKLRFKFIHESGKSSLLYTLNLEHDGALITIFDRKINTDFSESGKYMAVLSTENGEKFYLDFNVVK